MAHLTCCRPGRLSDSNAGSFRLLLMLCVLLWRCTVGYVAVTTPKSSTFPRRSSTVRFVDPRQTNDEDALWEASFELKSNQYMTSRPEVKEYLDSLRANAGSLGGNGATGQLYDPLWEQVKLEATSALSTNPEAGPMLYTGILSQKSLTEAIVSAISHEIATELFPATSLKKLFLEQLTREDVRSISFDLVAASTRSASVENAMATVLYHQGFHALVCYRLGHRLWLAGRTGLAYYMQSTVSRKYSADIHPAAKMGIGIHMRATAGVVIGETAVLGNDCSILEGVTLGGTGKESGDRHPKLGDGVTVQHGASILGNIRIGEGAIILSRSIVTKPVPPLAIVSGVPAKLESYRKLTPDEFEPDLQRHLAAKYLSRWKTIAEESMKGPDI